MSRCVSAVSNRIRLKMSLGLIKQGRGPKGVAMGVGNPRPLVAVRSHSRCLRASQGGGVVLMPSEFAPRNEAKARPEC